MKVCGGEDDMERGESRREEEMIHSSTSSSGSLILAEPPCSKISSPLTRISYYGN